MNHGRTDWAGALSSAHTETGSGETCHTWGAQYHCTLQHLNTFFYIFPSRSSFSYLSHLGSTIPLDSSTFENESSWVAVGSWQPLVKCKNAYTNLVRHVLARQSTFFAHKTLFLIDLAPKSTFLCPKSNKNV